MMSVAKNYSMRYIARQEQKGYLCYWVRVGLSTPHCKHKTFIDHKYGGKLKAKKAAQAYRDEQLRYFKRKYKITFPIEHDYPDKGVNYVKDIRPSGNEYWNWCASYYDNKLKKQFKRSFSVNKYGYQRAKNLAIQWRELKRTGVLNDI